MRDDLEGMPAEEPVAWYIARDGRQYGPLSDDEMRRTRPLAAERPALPESIFGLDARL
jgi:hypothetical protein